MNDDFAITLKLGELLALLDLLGFSSMNGLPVEPLAGMAEKQQQAVLHNGLQTLIRRGLATQTGDVVTLDDAMTALVSSCVRPHASLVLVGSLPGGAEEVHLFNATPDILVEHSFIHLDSHTFRFFARGDSLLARVREVLTVLQSPVEPMAFSGVWPLKTLNEAIAQARAGRQDKAVKTLLKAGWPQAEAQAFAAAGAQGPTYTAVYAWALTETPIGGQRTVMIIADRRRCWLAEPQGAAQTHVSVRSVAGDSALTTVMDMAQGVAAAAMVR